MAAALAVCGALVAAPRAAFASETDGGDGGEHNQCHPVCRQDKLACKLTARTSRRSCAEDCRASLQPHACFEACKGSFVSSRQACSNTATTCHDDCDDPGNQPSPCVNSCLQDLRRCLSGLGSGGHGCWDDCVTSAQAASSTCWTAPHPVQCLLGIAHDLSECLGGCAVDIEEGAAACKEAAEQCKQACEAGSASRAFLDARPALLE